MLIRPSSAVGLLVASLSLATIAGADEGALHGSVVRLAERSAEGFESVTAESAVGVTSVGATEPLPFETASTIGRLRVMQPALPAETLPELSPVPPIDLQPLAELTTSVVQPAGELPRDLAAESMVGRTISVGEAGDPIRTSAPYYSTPRAANFVHRPLYFEERATERHGRSLGALQPIASFAHFFGTIPILPYKMGAQPQPMRLNTGDGVHIRSDRYTVRQHLRGAAAQAGAVVGVNALLP